MIATTYSMSVLASFHLVRYPRATAPRGHCRGWASTVPLLRATPGPAVLAAARHRPRARR